MGMEIGVYPGTRVGFWLGGHSLDFKQAFKPLGYYIGPPLENVIPGQVFEQKLMEGILKFKVGVLFRPDLGKRNRLETILVLQNHIPEMFEYDTWTKDMIAREA